MSELLYKAQGSHNVRLINISVGNVGDMSGSRRHRDVVQGLRCVFEIDIHRGRSGGRDRTGTEVGLRHRLWPCPTLQRGALWCVLFLRGSRVGWSRVGSPLQDFTPQCLQGGCAWQGRTLRLSACGYLAVHLPHSRRTGEKTFFEGRAGGTFLCLPWVVKEHEE